MSPEVLEDLVWSAYEKLNQRDPEGSAALFHERCELLDVANGLRFDGQEGWRQCVQAWLGAFPDVRLERLASLARGDTVVTEVVGWGTHTGTLHTPDGEVPPTGRRVELRTCSVMRVEEGRIVQARIYGDTTSLLRQVGALPEIDAGAGATIRADREEENRGLARRWFQALNDGDLEVVDEMFAPDYLLHMAGNPYGAAGPEAIRVVIGAYRFAFPDLRFTVQGMVAEGETVVVRWVASGTQMGPLLGKQATGRHARWSGVSWLRFVQGKLVEDWTDIDLLGMMQQLGILSPAGGAQGF